MNLKERPEMGHFMNALRVLTLGGVWVMGDFPSVSIVAVSPLKMGLIKL